MSKRNNFDNDYYGTYSHEKLNTFPVTAFAALAKRPVQHKTGNAEKLKKQKEQFQQRYICPHCGAVKEWIPDTNVMVCTNPDCLKNDKGEDITYKSGQKKVSYSVLNQRGEAIAASILS